MKKKEIESMLSTDVPFKASDSLKGRIMEKAAREEPAAIRARSWKWARWAMPVAAALVLAVLVTVKPGVTPAIAAEKLFRTAAEYFSQRPVFSAKVEVRTLPQDNFGYTHPLKPYVDHTMTVDRENGVWRLEKSERAALYDGQYTWIWNPENGLGTKLDGTDQVGALELFVIFLDPAEILQDVALLDSVNPEARVRLSEKNGVITYAIDSPIQGDFSDKYMKYSSVFESDTRWTYTFDKASGRLLTFRIEGLFSGLRRTLFQVTDIDYDARVDSRLFEAPEEVDWLDRTAANRAMEASTLPYDAFRNIDAEQALLKGIDALQAWDVNALKVFFGQYHLRTLEPLKGCRLVSHEKPFTSGQFPGVFIRCTLERADGKTEKRTFALRNDKGYGAWTVDGGL